MSAVPGPERDGFVVVLPGDPRTHPLLEGLHLEYVERYGPAIGAEEMTHHPVADFTASAGGLLLLLEGGATVGGGAFRRHDDATAELKRVWTAPAHHRRGISRRVLAELERLAAAGGYRRIHLTTGNRQPKAFALYRSSGYVPLPGAARVYPGGVHDVGFEKVLR
ncbi:GNAT family N-acetyltransferase [Kocuria nitroreducens]|uniref:GNAT family N-acetyltransferase n=1 Tax=Kocuria nitroreducens TaxID=3058914 RepID=UPI0036DEEC8E